MRLSPYTRSRISIAPAVMKITSAESADHRHEARALAPVLLEFGRALAVLPRDPIPS
jgi:hypothetical protein